MLIVGAEESVLSRGQMKTAEETAGYPGSSLPVESLGCPGAVVQSECRDVTEAESQRVVAEAALAQVETARAAESRTGPSEKPRGP